MSDSRDTATPGAQTSAVPSSRRKYLDRENTLTFPISFSPHKERQFAGLRETPRIAPRRIISFESFALPTSENGSSPFPRWKNNQHIRPVNVSRHRDIDRHSPFSDYDRYFNSRVAKKLEPSE
ncbi:hypothetical protein K0M31_020107, partial [Melipona bicolor]